MGKGFKALVLLWYRPLVVGLENLCFEEADDVLVVRENADDMRVLPHLKVHNF